MARFLMWPRIFFAACGALCAGLALASAAQGGPPDGPPPNGPPQEAFAACEGKKAAESCTVQTPDGSAVSGQCVQRNGNDALHCRPAGPPPDARVRKPPPEAFSACQGKQAAAQCTVQLRDFTVNGACAADESGSLFCRPDRPPPPPDGQQR
jgi:hypothetical protein